MLDATVGGTNSNSYVTLTEACEYFGGRLHSDSWNNATDQNREKALIGASVTIDRSFVWKGRQRLQEQSLSFPRYGLFDHNGFYYDENEIPKKLKEAAYEYALILLTSDPKTDSPLDSGITRIKIESLSVDFDKDSILRGSNFDSNGIPTNVTSILNEFIERSTSTESGGTVRVVRR